jgi:hypothetical protein
MHDAFIPDPEVAREFGVSLMAIWRWDHSEAKAALGWPPKIQIGKRNFRSRNQLELFKKNLIRAALDARTSKLEVAADEPGPAS